jgi:hypothetical protein
MKSSNRILRLVLTLFVLCALPIAGLVIGWRLGLRDGVGSAYSMVSVALRNYHLALQKGDSEVMQKSIERLTEQTACHLVDTDVRSQMTSMIPYKSQASISYLKQAWQPPASAVLFPRPYYPHTPKQRDYRAAIDAIPRKEGDAEYAPFYTE